MYPSTETIAFVFAALALLAMFIVLMVADETEVSFYIFTVIGMFLFFLILAAIWWCMSIWIIAISFMALALAVFAVLMYEEKD